MLGTSTQTARVNLRVHYVTQMGENLFLERRSAGADAAASGEFPMYHAGGGFWTFSLDQVEPGKPIEYRYVFRGHDGLVRREPVFRRLRVSGFVESVRDEWLAAEHPDAAFLRQAFAGIIFQPDRSAVSAAKPAGRGGLRLTLRAPRVPAGHRICVTGDLPLLGGWDPARALVLSGENYPLWEIELPLADVAGGFEFKFGLWSREAGRLTVIEAGPNRRLTDLPSGHDVVVVNAEHFRHAAAWKGAGVAIPVFALRSEHGYGVGEFPDLERLAAWVAGCGLHLVQLLPVNDTSTDLSWRDSYPYKAISTAALHPIYLNLERLFEEARLPLPADYLARRDALNRLPQLDYEAVLRDKLAGLRQLYAATGAKTLRRRVFTTFLLEQGDWLKPYAAFCHLRDRHGTADFTRWGDDATFSPQRIAVWFKPGAPGRSDLLFHCFVQFHLRRQFNHALAAGHALGVAFKGDLPIGIDRGSVEAWTEPELFHMDRQTGAPPDVFSDIGQNWGFPTYNWRKMEADGYVWWKRRFHRMSACFDALRIDHILGFFRIWEIPGGRAEGIFGHFNPTRPLSPDELRARGFTRDVRRFTVPAVTPANLPLFFGDDAAKVAEQLLIRGDDGFLRLRPEFERREARQAWFASNCSEAEAGRIAAGLQRFEREVLFLEDLEQPDRFHPRINGPGSVLGRSLAEPERVALQALHDDFFFRRHTRFWEDEAMKKLPVLMDATGMLICGEDLGMIPEAVPAVLQRLGLLSLEVQSMPKRPGQRLGHPPDYPYFSVCTTSTHDTPTIRGWWEEEAVSRQAYWQDVMHRNGPAPAEASPEICRFILGGNLAGGSMWCVLPLQDWLAIDAARRHLVAAAERINVPANSRHYWRYRMHLTLEELQAATDFNREVARLVVESGRQSPSPPRGDQHSTLNHQPST